MGIYDEEFCYALGLWRADRCSSAKGIVGLRSKDSVLLAKFAAFLRRYVSEDRLRTRTVIGYGITSEVYACRLPLRKLLEQISNERIERLASRQEIAAYLAGLMDGDGSADSRKKTLCFAYGKKDAEEIKKDTELVEKLGCDVSVHHDARGERMFVLRPSTMAREILPFVVLERKRKELSGL